MFRTVSIIIKCVARWKRKVRASREARLKLEAEAAAANGTISNGSALRPYSTSSSGHFPYQNGGMKNGGIPNGFPNGGVYNGGINLQKRKLSMAARISGVEKRPGIA